MLSADPTHTVRALLRAELIEDPGSRGRPITLPQNMRHLVRRVCESGRVRTSVEGGLVLTAAGDQRVTDFVRQYGVIPRTMMQEAEWQSRQKARRGLVAEEEIKLLRRLIGWTETQIRRGQAEESEAAHLKAKLEAAQQRAKVSAGRKS